jgi:D-glycero-D-manno-heptose 1,7-bisphosphate phosphatase
VGEREVTRLAILDRDGTLIDIVRHEDEGSITVAFHPSHVRLLPGVVEGLRLLREAGFTLAMATNQPGPAKGQFSAAAVRATNDALVARLAAEGVPIEAVEVCMHHPDGGPGGDAALVMRCDCRKPKGGMLRTLLSRTGAAPAESWMIGDSVGDVQAGRAAGVRTGLVLGGGRCELCPLRGQPAAPAPDVHGPTFLDVARAIVVGQN